MEEKDYLDKIATQDDILQILTMVGEIGKEIKSGLDGSQGFRKNEYETVSKFLSLPHDENDGGNLTVRQLTYLLSATVPAGSIALNIFMTSYPVKRKTLNLLLPQSKTSTKPIWAWGDK